MTTVIINDSLHTLLMEKQTEIKRKYNIKKSIADITNAAIRVGINNVERELRLARE